MSVPAATPGGEPATPGPAPARPGARRWGWLRVFVIGLALWLASVFVTYATQNPTLIPTLVLLGSFLVPVTVVYWAFEHRESGELTAELIMVAFLVGGVLGVLGASVLEAYLLSPSIWVFLFVGLIEEGVKLVALILIGSRVHAKTLRDGIVLGASVGFGFAALESAGYAFDALLTLHGLSLRDLVETQLLRGALAPVGHGLWTAIVGGVLFATARDGRYRLTRALIISYLGISVLHALWDAMPAIAVWLTLLLTGTSGQIRLLRHGVLPEPTGRQVQLFNVIDIGGLAVISVIGIVWLALMWRFRRVNPL
jgi:RsiW-degrading membrane proteinase PrsW (M82 family)